MAGALILYEYNDNEEKKVGPPGASPSTTLALPLHCPTLYEYNDNEVKKLGHLGASTAACMGNRHPRYSV